MILNPITGGSGLATDGTSTGATSQAQAFTNGITTPATTGVSSFGGVVNTGAALNVTASGSVVNTAINIPAGTQPATSASFGITAAAITVAPWTGGDSSSNLGGRFAGAGSGLAFTLGTGGALTGTGNSTSRGGTGGGLALTLGLGGAATGATGGAKGGDAGSVVITGNQGGSAQTHAGVSGTGSSFTFAGGTGGDNIVSGGTAGNGGSITMDAGVPGVAAGGATAGSKGTIAFGGTNASAINVGNTSSLTSITGDFSRPSNVLRVSTQFDAASTTTLATITGLSASVAAGRTYKFMATLHITADAAGGHKYAINGTATATVVIYQINSINNGTNAFRINSRQTALGGASGEAVGTAYFTTITGLITVNAAGTLTAQFAQNTATGTSSVLVGSTFEIEAVS